MIKGQKQIYVNKGRTSDKNKKIKENRLFFLFLVDTTDNTVQNGNSNNVFGDYSLYISKMNAHNIIKDKWEKLGIML